MRNLLWAAMMAGLLAREPALAADLNPTTATAKLTAPISTKTSRQGDRITAVVETPQPLEGAVLEGQVTKVKAPQRGLGKGKPEIVFQFDTMTFNGSSSPISANLTGVSNSKGVSNVDEEGQTIGRTSNAKRAIGTLIGAGAGAAIGAAAGGGSGAAKGAAIGGAAGLLISVTMTAAGSDIELFPGSRLTIELSSRTR
jgi:hypothetical protein